MENKTLLIVDDEKVVRESLRHWFEEAGYAVTTAEHAEAALEKFKNKRFDLCLLDMKLPGADGLELLKKIKSEDVRCIVILITAYASVASAITALKEGAYDYITKPVDPEELQRLVEKAFEQRTLKDGNVQLTDKIVEIIKPENLIGESQPMKKIFEMINSVAQTEATVMIRGERGTGKEVIARAIHMNSHRKYFPIVTVNCGAMNEDMLECELFGHEKGAVDGAHHRRKGKFEMADGGTIFLDEIGSLTTRLQVELLRTIDSKRLTRVGGTESILCNSRIIGATNESLEEKVKCGKFREDLYYRLNVFSIFIPPLRDRRDDILPLAEYFVHKFATTMNKPIFSISSTAKDFLSNYEWPGNVRELENAIERAVVVGKTNAIQVDDLPFPVSHAKYLDDGDPSLSAVERKHILNILEKNQWNISRSAEALQIDRVTLYHKIEKYGFRRHHMNKRNRN
jgi:DNA-binding NtrC family response regulator